MSPRRAKQAAGTISPLLARIVEALRQEPRYRAGHAEALRACGRLALVQVPARGVFDPREPELYEAIESVARAHLEYGEAKTTFLHALSAAHLTLERRDPIESGCLQLMGASETAHFYAGLAFGVTFTDFVRRW